MAITRASNKRSIALHSILGFTYPSKFSSRTLEFSDGSTKTLGVMHPGEYEFATSSGEVMEILSGELEVLLPDAAEWKSIAHGESFEVPAASSFQVKIHSITDYCCSYLLN